jgi:hypothetical protein
MFSLTAPFIEQYVGWNGCRLEAGQEFKGKRSPAGADRAAIFRMVARESGW